MANLTLAQKVDRVMRMLLGLRHWQVALALKERGFTAADIDEGYRLLRGLTVADVASVTPHAESGATRDERLRAWMHDHFAAVEVGVRRQHPQLADKLFPREIVSGASGTIHTTLPPYDRAVYFVKHYDELVSSGTLEAKEVQAFFTKRNLTEAHLAELRALVGAKHGPRWTWPETDFTEAERRLWDWYLDWSGIVRARVRDKRVLRELGFGGSSAGGADATKDATKEGTPGAGQGEGSAT